MLTHSVLVTGGPGSGKTSFVRILLRNILSKVPFSNKYILAGQSLKSLNQFQRYHAWRSLVYQVLSVIQRSQNMSITQIVRAVCMHNQEDLIMAVFKLLDIQYSA